mgnify:CR=1 FL=1
MLTVEISLPDIEELKALVDRCITFNEAPSVILPTTRPASMAGFSLPAPR